MIRINLIPPEYIERINRKALIAKVVLACIVVVGAVVLASAWHITREKAIESRLAAKQLQLQGLQKDVDRVKDIEAQIAEVQRYLDSINRINKGRFLYTGLMADLVSDMPSTLWLTSVNTSQAGDKLKVDLAVNSNSAYDLAYWINSLETSGPYSEVTVGGISVSDADDGNKRFNTQISVKYAGR